MCAAGPYHEAQAQQAKGYIESLASTRRSNLVMPTTTADWLRGLDEEFHALLVERGLCDPRQQAEPAPEADIVKLGEFIDSYIRGRATIKATTRINLKRCRKLLIDYFGSERALDSITPGDCDDFREHLGKTLAENTVRRVCGRSKQFFRAAVRKKLIAESPFADMKATNVTAKSFARLLRYPRRGRRRAERLPRQPMEAAVRSESLRRATLPLRAPGTNLGRRELETRENHCEER